MIGKISSAVAAWLAREGVVADSERELFAYGMYSLLFGLMPVLLAAILGLALGMLYEGLLLVVPFMLIRKFSGGYHLKSPGMCIVASTCLLALAMWLTKGIISSGRTGIVSCVTALAAVCICLCSPIDSEARRLSEKEAKVFRAVARGMTILAFAIYQILATLGNIRSAAPVGVGIQVVAVLQLPCLVKRIRS